ncbi:MAG: transcription elongation factor GreA [Myxococcota bacterium]
MSVAKKSKTFPMTPAGHENLVQELKHLKSEVRPQVIRAIEEARAHGDLSENAEYDAAKERQGLVEGRIRELETKIACCQVIDPSKLSGDKITFGATVTVLDCETDKEDVWSIVGEDEADLSKRKLSISSPLARALIGKSVGDVFEWRAPKGDKEYEVIDVCYG